MSFLFGSSEPAPLPAPPTKEDPSVTAAKEAERLALARRQGRSSTILSSPLGAGDPQNVNRPSLLGEV
jgi:hypothetical protein